MNKTVKVVKVETVKAGKTDRIVLHYEGTDGTTWKIGALAVKLPEASRTTLLAAVPGSFLTVTMLKEGAYWNLTQVTSATAAGATSNTTKPAAPTNAQKSGGYDNLGQQIGNSITNAVNSLGTGKTVAEYQQRAIDFIKAGNTIRELSESGGIVAETFTAPIADEGYGQDLEINEDLGF